MSQTVERKYKLLKNWLFNQGIDIPLYIEPYTEKEYQSRSKLSEIYWTSRDKEAYQMEKIGKVPWIKET